MRSLTPRPCLFTSRDRDVVGSVVGGPLPTCLLLRVLENSVLRRKFWLTRNELTGEWRKLHNDLYSSPNIIQVIKLRIVWWAEHVALGGVCVEAYRGFWYWNLRERDRLEDPGLGVMIILRWISRKRNVRAWTGWIWLRIGTGGGHLFICVEPKGSIKWEKFLD